jgi:hypothetical protein
MSSTSFFYVLFTQTCVFDFASYNETEYPIAKAGVLANIGTNGAAPGQVLHPLKQGTT